MKVIKAAALIAAIAVLSTYTLASCGQSGEAPESASERESVLPEENTEIESIIPPDEMDDFGESEDDDPFRPDDPPDDGRTTATGYSFALSADGSYYIVTGYDESGDIAVPPEYENKPVKEIAAGAFRGRTDILSVTLPTSVTRIGEEAFAGCSGIDYFFPSASLVYVGKGAFDGCENLVCEVIDGVNYLTDVVGNKLIALSAPDAEGSVSVAPECRVIYAGAFRGNLKITAVTLADKVAQIGDEAFKDCASLSSAYYPSAALVGEDAFSGCPLLAP